jgi:heat shock protein HtpX
MLLGTLLGVLVCPIPLLADGWRGTHSYELLTTRDYLLVSDVMGWLMLIAWMAAALCLRIVRTVWRPEREYAADDVAAHLTGDPLGLADALESIAGASRPLARANRGIAHLFITNPFEGRADGPSLNTYAPISRRTQLLRAMSIEAPDGRRLRRRPSNDHWGVT